MRRQWIFSLYGPGMLWLFRVFWKFKWHFLKSLVIRIWWWNKRAWVGKIVTNLGYSFQVIYGTGPCSTKNGVEPGISSLCDVTFRMRGCQRCHSKLEQNMKWSFLRHLCLRRYFSGVHCILYLSGSSVRRNLRTSGRVWIQCDLYKSKPFPSWSQSSI